MTLIRVHSRLKIESIEILSMHTVPSPLVENLDMLPGVLQQSWNNICSLPNLLYILEEAVATHCDWKTKERPVLDMPAKQYVHYETG